MYEVYDLYSAFDIEKHKEHYVNYLETVILPDGSVEYAVPSHQEKLIQVYLKNHPTETRTQLYDACPPEYTFDVVKWLCKITGCVSVWDYYIIYYDINHNQISTLRQLKHEDLYKGEIPDKI